MVLVLNVVRRLLKRPAQKRYIFLIKSSFVLLSTSHVNILLIQKIRKLLLALCLVVGRRLVLEAVLRLDVVHGEPANVRHYFIVI